MYVYFIFREIFEILNAMCFSCGSISYHFMANSTSYLMLLVFEIVFFRSCNITD